MTPFGNTLRSGNSHQSLWPTTWFVPNVTASTRNNLPSAKADFRRFVALPQAQNQNRSENQNARDQDKDSLPHDSICCTGKRFVMLKQSTFSARIRRLVRLA